MPEMFYLLRVVENPNYTQMTEGFEGGQFGLFRIQDRKSLEPLVHSPDLKYGFNDTSKLGTAIGKFFRERDASIDSIAATGRIELNVFPMPLPNVDWSDPVVLYDRFSKPQQYIDMIVAMTEELDG